MSLWLKNHVSININLQNNTFKSLSNFSSCLKACDTIHGDERLAMQGIRLISVSDVHIVEWIRQDSLCFVTFLTNLNFDWFSFQIQNLRFMERHAKKSFKKNKERKNLEKDRETRSQFHQHFLRAFFVQIFCQSQNVTRKKSFVWKILA